MKRTENTATDSSMNAARTSSYSGCRKHVTHGRVRYYGEPQAQAKPGTYAYGSPLND